MEFRKTRFEQLEARQLLTEFTPALLHDFSPGEVSSEFSNFIPTEERLYFNVNGDEFWQTDGTADGTGFLGNLVPWNHRTDSGEVVPFDLPNGKLLFNVENSVWITDGTMDGTRQLISEGRLWEDLIHGEGYSIAQVVSNNGRREIWRIGHGDSDDVSRLAWQDDSDPRPKFLLDGDTIYISHLGTQGALVRIDATDVSEVLTESLVGSSWLGVSDVVSADNGLHFFAREDEQSVLYRIASNTAQPVRLLELSDRVTGLRAFGERVAFFSALPYEEEFRLWFYDDVDASPVPGLTFHSPFWRNDLNGIAIIGPYVSYRSGVYRTDGTVEGTYQLSSEDHVGQSDGRVYISSGGVPSFTDGTTVWESGDALVEVSHVDVLPPPPSGFYDVGTGYIRTADYWSNSSYPATFYRHEESGDLVPSGSFWEFDLQTQNVGDTVYIAGVTGSTDQSRRVLARLDDAFDPIVQRSSGVALIETTRPSNAPLFFGIGSAQPLTLWALDGAVMVEEIGRAEAWSTRQTETDFFFRRTTAESGAEVWASDGTSEGTVEVEIWPGPQSSNPEFIEWNGAQIVAADGPGVGRELWVIDGSFEQTPYAGIRAEVANFRIEPGSSLNVEVSVSSPEPNDELQYEWDLNDNGQFDDFTGQNGTITWEQLSMLQPSVPVNTDVPVRVRITPSDGESIVESAFLRIANDVDQEPPNVVDLRAVVAGDTLASITVDFSEPVTLGGFEFRVSGPAPDVRTLNLAWNTDRTSFTWDATSANVGVGWHWLTMSDVKDDAGNQVSGTRDFRPITRYIQVTSQGDINRDFTVDFTDFLILSRNFGRTDADHAEGDLSTNGVVDFDDFLILSRTFSE